MNDCNDHWCDYYGKGSEKCDRCVKKDNEQDKDKAELRVILKRRAYNLMEVDKEVNKAAATKNVSQER